MYLIITYIINSLNFYLTITATYYRNYRKGLLHDRYKEQTKNSHTLGNGIQPFVEANWWHSDANNSLDFDGVTISDDTPADRFELKLGLQGEIAKNWQAWGHVGAQTGDNSYSRYEGMVGIKHIF